MFSLASTYRACFSEDRIILLNLGTDQYLLAPQEHTNTLRAIIEPASGARAEPHSLNVLYAQGIIDRALWNVPLPLPIPSVEDVHTIRSRTVPAAGITRALGYQIHASMRLRFRKLSRALVIPEASATSAQLTMDDAIAAVKVSERILPSTDKCLRRSLALRLFLNDLGISTDLIIGVRLRPFGAHCWLQTHGRILNDQLDRVRPFTPILMA